MSPGYDANDPELLFWVAATLLHSAVLAYERFMVPLNGEEKDRFLRETQAIGALFGIPGALHPGSWLDFKRWMAQQLAGDTLTVTPAAREILGNLLGGTRLTRVLAPFNHVIATMLLPAPLAVRFGLKRHFRDRLRFQAMCFGTRVLARAIPWSWRGVPDAHPRERRTAG